MRRRSDVIRLNIRAEMVRRDWRQQELGNRMGRPQWWVSRRVSGAVRITTDDLLSFAKALGVSVEKLVKEHDDAAAA